MTATCPRAHMPAFRVRGPRHWEMLSSTTRPFMSRASRTPRSAVRPDIAGSNQTRLEISAIPFKRHKRRPVTHAMSSGGAFPFHGTFRGA